jgi:hypothetical protein
MGFFYDPFTQLGRHLLYIAAIDTQLLALCSFDRFNPMQYRHSTHTFSG